MRTIKLTIAATETHCGGREEDCQFSETQGGCRLFGRQRVRHDLALGYFFDRLPGCIAAEKEAGK